MMEKNIKQTSLFLAVQFVLGMILNLLGDPTEIGNQMVKSMYYVVIVLHILVALWLLMLLWQILNMATGLDKKFARRANGAFGIALAAGLLTTRVEPKELWSFVMALGFLATFRFLGRISHV